jgi:peptidoglycan-N-acetylmuramic acid deacetylase
MINTKIATKTKKALSFVISAVMMFSVFSSNSYTYAARPREKLRMQTDENVESKLKTAPYGWYFKKNSTHTQPDLDPPMKFIEDYNGYYIDKKHKNPDDTEKVIYLTFDVGYENGNVARILDILKEENVPGAFFILDNLILRNTDLVKRMADEGHLVCNHTMRHKDMTKITDKSEFQKEIKDLEDLYREKMGLEMAKYYRPPEGKFTEQNMQYISEMGYKTIFWSFAYADWDNNKQMDPALAVKKVLDHTHNGAVILLHPTSATNAAILNELIYEWKSQGYRFGTLDELTDAGAGETEKAQ